MSEVAMDSSSIYLKKSFIWKQRVGYGLLESGRFLADFLINLYLMIYLTDTIKMPVAAVGLMFLVCKIIDAFVDYIVGVFVDRTNTKYGRSRPWLFFGAIVISIGLVLVFISPDFSMKGKIIWIYSAYIFYSIGLSLLNIPEFAILPALSSDSVERTALATSRQIFGNIINLVGAYSCAFLLSRLGANNPVQGYLRTAMVMAIVVVSLIMIGIAMMKEINLPKINNNDCDCNGNIINNKIGVFEELKIILTNKRYLQFGFMAALIAFGFMTTLASGAFFFKHVVGNMMLLGTSMSALSIAQFIGMFLCPSFNKKFTKRSMIIGGILVAMIGYCVLFFGHSITSLIIAGYFLIGLGFAFSFTMYFALMPDVFDYLEYVSGKQMCGVPGAVTQYLIKIGNALSSASIAWILTSGGYNANLEVQSASAKFAATSVLTIVPFVSISLALICFFFFDLDKIYPKIKEELEIRRGLKNN